MPPSAEEQTVQEPSSTSFPCLQAQNAEIPYPRDIYRYVRTCSSSFLVYHHIITMVI